MKQSGIITIVIFLLVELVGAVWWASTINSQVQNTQTQVNALSIQIADKQGVYLTRDQLNDILGGRDQKVTNIEASVLRIETKLDKVLK